MANKKSLLYRKRQLFERTKSVILENLDLANIIHKLLEIEKLKFLILDPEQLRLFQFIPKPKAELDQIGKKNHVK